MALAVYPIINSTFSHAREHGQPCVKLSFNEQALENESIMKQLGTPVIKTFWCTTEEEALDWARRLLKCQCELKGSLKRKGSKN